MENGLERRIGLLAFFDKNDTNKDGFLDKDELAVFKPEFAFDGTDVNADGIVSRDEVVKYVEIPGRLYRKLGLGNLFELIDTNNDDTVSPDEIEAAHKSGQLARG